MLRSSSISTWGLSAYPLEHWRSPYNNWMHGKHCLATLNSTIQRGTFFVASFVNCLSLISLLYKQDLSLFLDSKIIVFVCLFLNSKRGFHFWWPLLFLKGPPLALWLSWPLILTQGISYMFVLWHKLFLRWLPV